MRSPRDTDGRMSAMYEDIEIERIDGIGVARFAAGEHNAVRHQTLAELCAALDELIGDPDVRAILLAARGRHFVAGADLTWLAQLRRLSPAELRTAGAWVERVVGGHRRANSRR